MVRIYSSLAVNVSVLYFGVDMGVKKGTSDLHFGHLNILKFTNRWDQLKECFKVHDGHKVVRILYERYMDGEEITEEEKGWLVSLMDNWLLGHVNRQIDDGDTIYHTGDFSFYKGQTKDKLKAIVTRLKGNWIFTLGNHDNESALREACKGTNHKVVGDYHEITVNKTKVVLFHYPIEDWNGCHRGSYMLHGHLHGTDGHGDFVVRKISKRFDIGMDAHPELKLFNLEELVV